MHHWAVNEAFEIINRTSSSWSTHTINLVQGCSKLWRFRLASLVGCNGVLVQVSRAYNLTVICEATVLDPIIGPYVTVNDIRTTNGQRACLRDRARIVLLVVRGQTARRTFTDP